MAEHEHGQIVRIGVGDIEMFTVDIHGCGEATLINHLDEFVGNGLGAKARRDGIQSKTRNRGLRHTRRRTGGMLHLLHGGRGDRHGTSQIIRRGENGKILLRKAQSNTGLIAQLQTI